MEFNATLRSVQGSSASRRLRRAGRVPAIVYGGNEAPLNIELDHNEIFHLLRKEEFHSSVLTMKLDGKQESVILRSVQWHPYKPLVMHVDFQRVLAKQAITTKVPLRFVNAENSPAVKLSAAVVTYVQTELPIECLPADLPQHIEVDLSNLQAGGLIHLADIKLPANAKYVAHAGDENPLLASATVPAGSSQAEGGEAEGQASGE